MRKLHSS